jgi:PAS domain S-box-containing protein
MTTPETSAQKAQVSPWESRTHFSRIAPWVVLVTSLALTGWVWRIAVTSADDLARLNFQRQSEAIQQHIADGIATCEHVLLGGAGLFAARGEVSRAEWRDYIETLKPAEKLAGIQGFGFTLRIPASGLPTHLAQIRSEGFPTYSITPAHEREEYHSIIYLEPFSGRNLRAFGYDMATEPVRRRAMDQARDEGRTTMTGPVTLVQEVPGQAIQKGFLIYVPVYSRGLPVGTVPARRAALRGYVYSPFRAGDFINALLLKEANTLALDIYTEGTAQSESLLYSSQANPGAEKRSTEFLPRYTSTTGITLLGHRWYLVFKSTRAFEASQAHTSAPMTLAFGLICSLLASGLLFAQSSRNRALSHLAQTSADLRQAHAELEQRIKDRTADLAQVNQELKEDILARKKAEEALLVSETALKAAQRVAKVGNWVWRISDNKVEWSDEMFHIYGLEKKGFSGDIVEVIAQAIHPEDRAAVDQANKIMLERQTPSALEHRVVWQDGTIRTIWSETGALLCDAQGRPQLITGISQDITERMREQKKLTELLAQTESDAHTKGELLREVNHRVTNNLTAVLGLLVYEKEHLPEGSRALVWPVLDRFQQRIRSLLQVHRMLAQSSWAPVRLDQLAGQIIRSALSAAPWRHEAVVMIAPGELKISPRQAGSVAMILNELATNTVKYAGQSSQPVEIRFEARSDQTWVTLRYRDNGPGYPSAVLAGHRSNVGLKLIHELISQTLRGTLVLTNDNGAVASISIRNEEESRT